MVELCECAGTNDHCVRCGGTGEIESLPVGVPASLASNHSHYPKPQAERQTRCAQCGVEVSDTRKHLLSAHPPKARPVGSAEWDDWYRERVDYWTKRHMAFCPICLSPQKELSRHLAEAHSLAEDLARLERGR